MKLNKYIYIYRKLNYELIKMKIYYTHINRYKCIYINISYIYKNNNKHDYIVYIYLTVKQTHKTNTK